MFLKPTELKVHMSKVHEPSPNAISYPCDSCSRSFSTRNKLIKHKRVHVDNLPLKCAYCDKRFVRTDLKIIHERGHTGEKPFTCEKCNRSFTTKSSLKIHTASHLGLKNYHCQYCEKSFVRKDSLNKHLTSHGIGKQEIIKCQICSQVFPTEYYLKVHKKQNHLPPSKPVKYHCRVCSKTYSKKVSFQYHMKTHSASKAYKCSTCNLSFPTKGRLGTHSKIHADRHIACVMCGHKFLNNSSLRIHCNKVHNMLPDGNHDRPLPMAKRQVYNCGLCSKSYSTKHSLHYHLKTHTSYIPHKCITCSKRFHTKGALSGHSKIHSVRHIACSMCDRMFVSSHALRVHCNRVHSATPSEREVKLNPPRRKQFTCNLCGKRYPAISSYLYHLKSHLAGTPVKCSICSKSFPTKARLLCHSKIHTTKQVACSMCDLMFINISALRKHLVQVHGQKAKASERRKYFPDKLLKHACNFCPRKYPYRESLQRHMKTHVSKPERFPALKQEISPVKEPENLMISFIRKGLMN